MTESAKQSMRDSKTIRWIALAIISFTMFCGYFFEKVTSAIKPALDSAGWTSSQFGFFKSSYGWVTVFLGGLIIGGIILDKKGVRFSGILATIMMVIGASLCGMAFYMGGVPEAGWTPAMDWMAEWGWSPKKQMWVASVGFAVFCMGDELAGITVSKVIVKWFKGKELALAMGLEMAFARMGSGMALAIGPMIALAPGFLAFGGPDVAAPILLGVGLLALGMIAFIFYTGMDRKLDASEPVVPKASALYDTQKDDTKKSEDEFKFSDIMEIFRNQGFWLIAMLCVLFYSAVFVWMDYGTDLMVQKYGFTQETGFFSKKNAGLIPAMLPFGTILLTPIFGNIYDRKGKGASIMALGALILIVVHTIFSIPTLTHTGFAIFAVLLLGIAFSLVPSAMWPSVPKLIPEKQLGTAYATIFFIQNIGLMGVPYLIGIVLDKYCITSPPGAEVTTYNYTLPMVIFTVFGILALCVALMLRIVDGKKGYGLELPNIKK